MPGSAFRQEMGASLGLADAFVRRARSAANESELRALMDDICHELGFRHYALLHHVDPLQQRPGQIFIENYPPAWAEQFVGERLFREDPMVQACLRTNAGFLWSRIHDLIQLNSGQRTLLETAARVGLKEGLTIPACVTGEWTGSCSLARPRGGRIVQRHLLVAQIIGVFGFQAARRITSGGAFTIPQRPVLNPRQRECTVLAGQGKTDWEIAGILGLSHKTVRHYIADARARYDVTTRQQLVICALLDGQISLAELAPRQYVRLSG
jgi:LuxR family quorum-sensing system transcriptional regulator CciR